jgi:HK97 gp10 family phage protein
MVAFIAALLAQQAAAQAVEQISILFSGRPKNAAARETGIRIEGLAETQEALTALSRSTQKNVVLRALLKAGEPIEEAAAAGAPHLSGALQRSVTTGTKLSRRQRSEHRKESEVEVFVGAGALAQAHLQEFGTFNNPAQPFLRPAWDGNKDEALDIFTKELKAEIDKSVKQAEAKAKRIMARGGFRR